MAARARLRKAPQSARAPLSRKARPTAPSAWTRKAALFRNHPSEQVAAL